MKIAHVGYGAGDRDFPEHANLLRIVIGEPTAADEALSVCVIEANIDDINRRSWPTPPTACSHSARWTSRCNPSL